MSGLLTARPARGTRVLFAEDFDDVEGVLVIEAPREPEVVAAVFTAADVEIVREHAHAEGRAAAAAEAEAAHAVAVRATLADVAAAIDALAAQQQAAAAEQAEGVARLLLDTLMTLLPALCQRHGEAEVRAVAAAVLPALAREPAVVVRVHPERAAAAQEEIERLDPDLAQRVRLVAVEALGLADIRIGWRDGSAVRDAEAIWNRVAAVLKEAGLLLPAASDAEAGLAG